MLQDSEDCWKWTKGSSGLYLVNSIYLALTRLREGFQH